MGLLEKRTANSLIADVVDRFRAIERLKVYERNSLCHKISAVEKKVEALKETAERLKPNVAANQTTEKELARYRKAKRGIFERKQKLNRMRHKLADFDGQIERRRYRVCFGSRKFFKAQYNLSENDLKSHEEWHKRFRERRDSNIYYLGDSHETACNQEFQLTPVDKNGTFDIKIRTSKASAARKAGKEYVVGRCQFSYKEYAEFLADNLLREPALPPRELAKLSGDLRAQEREGAKDKRVSISYRLVCRGRKTYICASFEYTLRDKETDPLTDRRNGVVGLDFNSGHIQLSETDAKGNLVRLKKYRLRRHGNAMASDLREAVAHITKDYVVRGKPLAIEGLDFSKKKSNTTKAKSDGGKEYNRMIHK